MGDAGSFLLHLSVQRLAKLIWIHGFGYLFEQLDPPSASKVIYHILKCASRCISNPLGLAHFSKISRETLSDYEVPKFYHHILS